MSEILGNVYHRYVIIVFGTVVFGTVFFRTFLRSRKLLFSRKFFQNLILMFSFYPKKLETWFQKNFHNSNVVSRRKLFDPSLGNVFNLLSIGLRYTLSFEWSDFSLKYLVTVMLKGQPPKFKASVWNFPNSETDSKCNSVFRHAGSN